VLAIGGAESTGEAVANTMKLTADDVQTLVIPAAPTGSPSRLPNNCSPR
jgi:ATP-dependent protease ClpP protease subunit